MSSPAHPRPLFSSGSRASGSRAALRLHHAAHARRRPASGVARCPPRSCPGAHHGPRALLFLLTLLRDLRQHRLLVNLDRSGVLLETLVGFAPLRLREVPFPVVQHGVHVRPVLHREVQRASPVEQPHVHVDGPVRRPRLQQNRLSLIRLSPKQRQLSHPPFLRRDLPNRLHELHLLNLLHRGVRNLRRVQVLVRHGHRRETRPHRIILDETAQTNSRVPLPG
mmetsp:Transcript_5196/g.23388  ORF Transcript_5196/g.23388 Transcript_5196/m.23388 type:complete len:223 (+) Transcript_5196:1674-2342(+)